MGSLITYLKKAIEANLIYKLDWHTLMFTILGDDDFENEYIIISDKKLYGKIMGEKYLINEDMSRACLVPTDKIKLPKGYISIIKEDIETTIGRLIANVLLIEYPFNGKVEYINKKMSIKELENNIIVPGLKDDPKEGDISIEECKKFANAVTFLKNLARYLNVSARLYTVTPPVGITEFKKKLKREFLEKYGEDAFKDRNVVLEFEDKILEYEKEYIKKDPDGNKFTKIGKVGGVRKKLFGSYGIGESFKPKQEVDYIDWSLSEGYTTDRDDMTVIFNDIRLGSYNRGVQTAKAGVAAKDALRSTNNLKIVNHDCGTKLTQSTLITEDNKEYYISRYMMVNGKTVLITEEIINSKIGKSIELRTPLFCKEELYFCRYCLNENTKDYEQGVAIMATDIGGALLNDSMSAMHKFNTEMVTLSLSDLTT